MLPATSECMWCSMPDLKNPVALLLKPIVPDMTALLSGHLLTVRHGEKQVIDPLVDRELAAALKIEKPGTEGFRFAAQIRTEWAGMPGTNNKFKLIFTVPPSAEVAGSIDPIPLCWAIVMKDEKDTGVRTLCYTDQDLDRPVLYSAGLIERAPKERQPVVWTWKASNGRQGFVTEITLEPEHTARKLVEGSLQEHLPTRLIQPTVDNSKVDLDQMARTREDLDQLFGRS